MKNITITLTGIDEKTNLHEASRLQAELGILYSAAPEGRNRYPRFEWIRDNSYLLPNKSLHVCGSKARAELMSGKLTGILGNFRRIQVNGVLSWQEVNAICFKYYWLEVITQHNHANEFLWRDAIQLNHQILIDASGGRGISPAKWIRPDTDKIVGFAGGLGPDNLARQMETIRGLAAGELSWVDMEEKLRVDDWFSIEEAKKAIRIFEENQ